MRSLILTLLSGLIAVSLLARDPLGKRIVHSDLSNIEPRKNIHQGPGEMRIQTLLPAGTLSNLGFFQIGLMYPKSGIGHHFHPSDTEEMFLILGDEAEFTINGRTSMLKGPVGAPARTVDSHAIYNSSNKEVWWMDIQIRVPNSRLNRTDSPRSGLDLEDDRVGVSLDPRPAFLTTKLHRNLLTPQDSLHGGRGRVQYRRALGPNFFASNLAYVDHLLLPPDTSVGRHKHEGVEEIYFVMAGEGQLTVDSESAPVHKLDALPIFINEVHAIGNAGREPLELMIIGISREKGVLDTVLVK